MVTITSIIPAKMVIGQSLFMRIQPPEAVIDGLVDLHIEGLFLDKDAVFVRGGSP